MNKRLMLAALILVVQCLGIRWLILRYERVVTYGTEVRFRCQAYDPYDPLRGRYLRVNVRERCDFPAYSPEKHTYDYRNKLYAKIECGAPIAKVVQVAENPEEEGLWVKPASSYASYKLNGASMKKDESWDDFYKRQKKSGVEAEIVFPSQLFVNKDIASDAEKLLAEKTKDAIAVYRVLNQKIVLTDIEIGGTSITKLVK